MCVCVCVCIVLKNMKLVELANSASSKHKEILQQTKWFCKCYTLFSGTSLRLRLLDVQTSGKQAF